MTQKKEPRLRTVDKLKPPYDLNTFPKDFPLKIASDVVYLLATRGRPSLEGEDWEQIFAHAIGADWKPSNIGRFKPSASSRDATPLHIRTVKTRYLKPILLNSEPKFSEFGTHGLLPSCGNAPGRKNRGAFRTAASDTFAALRANPQVSAFYRLAPALLTNLISGAGIYLRG